MTIVKIQARPYFNGKLNRSNATLEVSVTPFLTNEVLFYGTYEWCLAECKQRKWEIVPTGETCPICESEGVHHLAGLRLL
jgi:hypothetical protein